MCDIFIMAKLLDFVIMVNVDANITHVAVVESAFVELLQD
jgi:hypothetical protein